MGARLRQVVAKAGPDHVVDALHPKVRLDLGCGPRPGLAFSVAVLDALTKSAIIAFADVVIVATCDVMYVVRGAQAVCGRGRVMVGPGGRF